MRYVSLQLTSHAFRIRVKFDGLAMAKRVQGILSRILVRENYFFDQRGGARSSRKVGSGLTEGISRYKAELYTTRLRSNLFVQCARGDLPRKFKGSLANIVPSSPCICNPSRIRFMLRNCIAMGLSQWPCEVFRNLARR